MFYGGSKSGESQTSEYERMRAACDALKRAAERRINNTKKRKPTVTYLIMLRCQSDDIPLYLSNDEGEARGMAVTFAAGDRNSLGEREAKLLSIDLGDKCNLSLFTFDGGRLVKATCLHDFIA